MIRGVAGGDTVQELVVSSVRVVTEVLRGSCIVVKTRQLCRDHRRQRQGEPGRAGRLVMNQILTYIKQSVMVAWAYALGALHPWTGWMVPESTKWPNNCHVPSDGGSSPSNDGLDAYKEPKWVYLCLGHIFRTLDRKVVPAPRWFRQRNTTRHAECPCQASKSLLEV